ncbi:DUF4136 domain-containing protein [Hyunsoonleella pacifica]|uniref:DUF4136 domain-containing protein n=1 Tax=Hyunsoonleella pacifica TaxID=1080224 RepID=A0A4Q9FIY2_9FLAO|nr:DUF4136 domain-containing protein [Hyunsoonleella pacifica]TBN12447.1 DUF4136 domain-containing protein [Hyunsoonleella pacifica]GGD29396.1 hypothetical protein GCM10011368_34250 [Hyunsoonleella pacifica]
MRRLLAVMIVFTIISCAPIYVNYDYDKAVDFSKYKTYQYFGDMETGLSELDTKRLLDAIDGKLKANGFTISETPDFLIDIKSEEFRNVQQETVGVGVGGGGGNVGGGISIGLPIGQSKMTRQLIFDFVDASNKQLFWQAKSESSYNPRATPIKREEQFIAIVEKVFKKYPTLSN